MKIYHALAMFEQQLDETFRSFIAEKQDLFKQYEESSLTSVGKIVVVEIEKIYFPNIY